MRRFVLSILVILILRAYAKELMNSIGNKLDLMHKVVDELRMQDQWLHQREDKNPDLDATTLGKPSHIAMSHQSLLPLQPQFSQPRPLFQNSLIPVQSSRLQSIWGRAMSPRSRGFLSLQPRPLFRNSPILLQPSRLQPMLGNARAAGRSSGSSSGAKPQRKGNNCGGRNRNCGNTQRYDCGNGKGPAALTAQIKKTTTIKELISTHHSHESRLNHIHLSACWTSLAR